MKEMNSKEYQKACKSYKSEMLNHYLDEFAKPEYDGFGVGSKLGEATDLSRKMSINHIAETASRLGLGLGKS